MLRQLWHRLELDRAIAFTVLTRGWSLCAGPLTLLLVSTRLTEVEQGYYYTLASLLALQVFFELGLTYTLTQFTAHEMPRLHLGDDGRLSGDPLALGRLGILTRRSLQWFGVAALLLLVVVTPAGWWFFHTAPAIKKAAAAAVAAGLSPAPVAWRMPWVLSVAVTAGGLVLTPLTALLNGCGLVAPVARIQFWRTLGGNLAFWAVLLGGFRLYAAPALNGVSLAIGAVLLVRHHRPLLRQLAGARAAGAHLSWRLEVWPLQWRIALSWLSGYFVSQLFNPVLFRFHGPQAAGRMGMSLAITGMLIQVARSWVDTKAPRFGTLAGAHRYAELNSEFDRALRLCTKVFAAGAVALVGAYLAIRWIRPAQLSRVLPPGLFAALLLTNFLGAFSANFAVYLRSFKREPLLQAAVVNALLMASGIWCFGRPYGATGIIAVFFTVQVIVFLPWVWTLFRRQRAALAEAEAEAGAEARAAGRP